MDQTRNQLLHQQQLNETAKSNQSLALTKTQVEQNLQGRKEGSSIDSQAL